MAFHLKNTEKNTILTEGDEEDYRNNNICQFCEREVLIDKVRDHCHLTGKYRGPAHNNCNFNVSQNKVISSHLSFTLLVIMIVVCSLRIS